MLADGADASLTIAVSEWDSLASPFLIRCTDSDAAVADGSGWHREPCASVPDISDLRLRNQDYGTSPDLLAERDKNALLTRHRNGPFPAQWCRWISRRQRPRPGEHSDPRPAPWP
jgi:hypothetical protein